MFLRRIRRVHLFVALGSAAIFGLGCKSCEKRGAASGAVDKACETASGRVAEGTSELSDGPDRAVIRVDATGGCERTYTLETSAPLRDQKPANPRVVRETAGQPTVRTNSDIFDALYALAIDEAREASVTKIKDGSFNHDQPLDCPPGGGAGGCFETGRLWTYVWTRDTSYSVELGLAAFDPARAKNSLDFKLSERRGGGDLQIVQDTGSGGSYPISTDRVVWARGAWEVLKYLEGAARSQFRDRTYDALRNTIEHDRAVVFDPADGLYAGETSFLDWREQTYPEWTAEDTLHIGMSKALSTNVEHARILEIAADLAAERTDRDAEARYRGWSEALKRAIGTRFWLEEAKSLAAFTGTFTDPAPVRRLDLLGAAHAVLAGVVDGERAKAVVESYPAGSKGPPVVWPEQKNVPVYHNRSIWPFVTAYWLKAARRVRNDAVVTYGVQSMMRGAALNLSNMENFELASGRPKVDEGPTSGPVINSQRQLWSVAGYLSMVHEVLFGLEATQTGLRFEPYVTKKLRSSLFSGADRLVLNGFRYRGKTVTVIVSLPPKGGDAGAYGVGAVTLDGRPLSPRAEVKAEDLSARSVLEIKLVDTPEAAARMRMLPEPARPDDTFGPEPPRLTSIALDAEQRVRLTFDPGKEAAGDVQLNVYRDGTLAEGKLAGDRREWTDPSSADGGHCYTIESVGARTGNTSQRALPKCDFTLRAGRVKTIAARELRIEGGEPVTTKGVFFHRDWGDAGHHIDVPSFRPKHTGEHWIQLVAANGAGPFNTGITCAVKRVSVEDVSGGAPAGSGYVIVPHTGGWERFGESSYVRVSLEAGHDYRIRIDGDERAVNMSAFRHFEAYTGGAGGDRGALNRLHVASVRVVDVVGSPLAARAPR